MANYLMPSIVIILGLAISLVTCQVQEGHHRNTSVERTEAKCSSRQDLLDGRLNGVEDRLNRIDDGLDELETIISDLKESVDKRINAIEEKAEWALTGSKETSTVTTKKGDYRPPKKPIAHKGCEEAYGMGWTSSGLYTVTPKPNKHIDVYCEQSLDGGGWTVIQSRRDGSVDFFRGWSAYKMGFGDLAGEFWLGNDNLYVLTRHHDQQLKVELTSPEGETVYADYSEFWVSAESNNYTLQVTGYSGAASPGDSMRVQNGQKFSTKDVDNDLSSTSCAKSWHGGWWYKSCHYANLNGRYNSVTKSQGLTWKTWKGWEVSMKASRMMIRRKP